MTSAQITYLLGLYPPTLGTDPTEYIKVVGLESGRTFSVNSQHGVAGRYALTLDMANGYASFAPVVPQTQGPEIVNAIETVPFEDIEAIAFLTV